MTCPKRELFDNSVVRQESVPKNGLHKKNCSKKKVARKESCKKKESCTKKEMPEKRVSLKRANRVCQSRHYVFFFVQHCVNFWT